MTVAPLVIVQKLDDLKFTLTNYFEDIDECIEDSTLCGVGTCLNTRGSFRCVCPDGFIPMEGHDCMGKPQGLFSLLRNTVRVLFFSATMF